MKTDRERREAECYRGSPQRLIGGAILSAWPIPAICPTARLLRSQRRYGRGTSTAPLPRPSGSGSVEACDESSAIEKAAEKFKTDAWRLIAVRRR
jgi:hypothetical protein